MDVRADDLVAWASSGAMALTGPAVGPPSAEPAGLAAAVRAAADDLAVASGRWGRRVEVDGPALLGERAALSGMTRNGAVSVGGAARFVRVADGWAALNLPRPSDVAALPALVSAPVAPDDWPAIERGLRAMTGRELVDQATRLGVAVGMAVRPARPAAPVSELARGGGREVVARPLVVDLTSLWAGPLATGLLAAAGARVIKVEGRGRPDGARQGTRAFFDLLNHEKECIEIDFGDHDDVALLRRLMESADLVVEGSRPRVMAQRGIDPAALAAAGTSWLSITAHGRTGAAADRIGFGDDAAVSGGVFVDGDQPHFVADAVADPLTGLVAAATGAALLGDERAAVVEAPLARVAAWARWGAHQAEVVGGADGWWLSVGSERVEVAAPGHRAVPGSAPAVDAHGPALRAEFRGPGRPARVPG